MRRFSLSVFFLALLLLLVSGCSSVVNSARQKQPMMNCFIGGNPSGALEIARKKHLSTANSGDELVWLLECGSLDFLLGNYAAAIDDFRRCEEVIEAYDERALVSVRDTSDEALAVLSNQNALPYRGWCRDRIALSFYKSLAYLGIGNEVAFRAQVKRLREEHNKIQEDYRKFFDEEDKQIEAYREKNSDAFKRAQNTEYLADERNAEYVKSLQETENIAHSGYGNFLNPISLFLSGIVLLRDGSWDNARIEFERLWKALPNSLTAQQYYVTTLSRCGRNVPAELSLVPPFNFPLERDCVYVIYAHDLAASFKQIDIYFPLMIAWPICEYHPSLMPNLTVSADGMAHVAKPLANMDGILAQEFRARMPARLTRTIISALVKEAGYIATVEALKRNNHGGEAALVSLAYRTYQAVFNTADTRTWQLLPKEYMLTQLPMPSDRTLTLTGVTGEQAINVSIPEGCGSAIIFVNAMSPANVACQVLPLK